MTKQLLTALLIAGLSATAKAEQNIYYCEMKSFVELTREGELVRYQPERFRMKLEKYSVTFSSGGYMDGRRYDYATRFDPNIMFRTTDGGLNFSNPILTESRHNAISGSVSSFVANCEDF